MELKDYVIQKELELNEVSNLREYSAFPSCTDYFRSNADIDYARVLYSSSARRLQGKMQLFVPKKNVFYRNRLTHSLEVSQIAMTHRLNNLGYFYDF
jgi:dGTPase